MLEEKEITKTRKEIIALHKRCIETALKQRMVSFYGRRKFFELYHIYVNINNIEDYFFKPINLFINTLVIGNQDDIKDDRTYPKVKEE